MKRIYNYDDILNYIILHKRAYDGLSPTLREIMYTQGIRSTSTMANILKCLEAEGKIKRTERGIMVTGGEWRYKGVSDV